MLWLFSAINCVKLYGKFGPRAMSITGFNNLALATCGARPEIEARFW
jgi:hypothetical protein